MKTENDFNILHDCIYDAFGLDLSKEQIDKLLILCPKWDGITDTLGKQEVVDTIANHFIGMNFPIYGDTEEYKNHFYNSLERQKEIIEKFIN